MPLYCERNYCFRDEILNSAVITIEYIDHNIFDHSFRRASTGPVIQHTDTSYCTDTQQHLTYYGGNPDLEPENSKSLTFGMVYDATDNLSLELSYYRYDYENKIESIDVDDLIAVDTDGTSSNIEVLSNIRKHHEGY